MAKKEKQANETQEQNLSYIMTEKQLAEHLNVSVYTVRRMRLSEGLPALKFDNVRAILYYLPAVEDWLRAKSVLPDTGDEEDRVAEQEESGKNRRPKYSMTPIPD